MGFRDDVLPILIYATDNMMRDPEALPSWRMPR